MWVLALLVVALCGNFITAAATPTPAIFTGSPRSHAFDAYAAKWTRLFSKSSAYDRMYYLKDMRIHFYQDAKSVGQFFTNGSIGTVKKEDGTADIYPVLTSTAKELLDGVTSTLGVINELEDNNPFDSFLRFWNSTSSMVAVFEPLRIALRPVETFHSILLEELSTNWTKMLNDDVSKPSGIMGKCTELLDEKSGKAVLALKCITFLAGCSNQPLDDCSELGTNMLHLVDTRCLPAYVKEQSLIVNASYARRVYDEFVFGTLQYLAQELSVYGFCNVILAKYRNVSKDWYDSPFDSVETTIWTLEEYRGKLQEGTDETIEKLRSNRQSIAEQFSSNNLFLSYKLPEQLGYYENITKVADIYVKFFVMSNYLDVPIWTKEERRERRTEAVEEYLDLFKESERVLREQPVPFGERECGFVPEDVRHFFDGDNPIIPRLSDFMSNLKTVLEFVRSVLQSGEEVSVTQSIAGIENACKAFDSGKNLTALSALVKPGCISRLSGNDRAQELQQVLIKYAQDSGFPWGGENGCLLVFIARYVNQSEEAVDQLKVSFDKYMYISVILQGFCSRFLSEGDQTPADGSAILRLASNSSLLILDNIPLHQNVSWDCSMKQRLLTTPTTASITSTTRPLWTTAPEIKERGWLDKAKRASKAVVDETGDSFRSMSWADRGGLQRTTARLIATNLTATFAQYNQTFHALVTLPFADNSDFCVLPLAQSDGHEERRRNLNYYFKRSINHENPRLQQVLDNVARGEGPNLLSDIFSRGRNAGGLCTDEADTALRRAMSHDSFTSAVIVRCGREFVWYELAYKYFHAADATHNYTLTTANKSAYDANCGQVIFFP